MALIRGELMSPSRVAALRGCSRRAVSDAIRRGGLPAYRINRDAAKAAWAVRPEDLDEWDGRRGMARVALIRGELMSPSRVAALRGCSRRAVSDAIRRGGLPAYRVNRDAAKPAWAIRPEDLDEWDGPNPSVGRPRKNP